MSRVRWWTLLGTLLVISVGTLVQAFVDDTHRMTYVIATSISHLALIVLGYTYAKAEVEKRAKLISDLRNDILAP